MAYEELLQALVGRKNQLESEDPFYSIGRGVAATSPVVQGASFGDNLGAIGLQGLLAGLGTGIGRSRVESQFNREADALRGFYQAPQEQRATMAGNPELSPFKGFLAYDQFTRDANAQKLKDEAGAELQKSLLKEGLTLSEDGGVKGIDGWSDVQQSRAQGLESAKERGKRLAIAESPGGIAPEDSRDIATNLRKELMGSPEYKNYSMVLSQAKNIKELAKKNDPVSNLGLVYSTVKLIDPASVVKEGEVSMVNLSQGPLARMAGEIQYAMETGGKLQEGTREKLTEMANVFLKSSREAYDTQEGPRVEIAKRYNINTQDLGMLPNYQEQSDAAGKPQGARVATLPNGETVMVVPD